MKIVVVWSSPNHSRLTASAKNSFISGIEKTDVEFEEVHLNNHNIEHCKACGNGLGICFTSGNVF